MAFFGHFLSPRKESDPSETNKEPSPRRGAEFPFFAAERKEAVGDKSKNVPRAHRRGTPAPAKFLLYSRRKWYIILYIIMHLYAQT